MGSLDSRGIWQYDNTDHVTPLATFMNLLATSTSNALAAAITSLTIAETPWINLPLASGVTAVSGYTPQYRKIGHEVFFQGRAQLAGTGSSNISTALAAAYRPVNAFMELGQFADAGASFRRLFISSTGILQCGASSGSSTQIFLGGSFIAAV